MTSTTFRGAILLAAACVGCTTSNSGGLVLFPLPYKLLDETKDLKRSHPNPIQWPRELAKNVTGPAVAEPGDVIAIAAVDPANRVPFVGEQPILLDGTIDLAKYGRVVVGYKTLAEIEAIVNAAVKGNGGKDVAVTVRFARAPDSKRIYVLGDVVTPGSYPMNGNETVLDAILLAGGLTRKADERNIILSRPTPVCDCRVVVPVCHEAIVQWGDTSTNYQLLPGDRIYVPSLSLFNRLFGRLSKREAPCCDYPSPCPLPPELCGNGCNTGCVKGTTGMVIEQHAAPAISTEPKPPMAPVPPKADPPRTTPPQPTLRETPRGATALPTKMFPAGREFEPTARTVPDRPKPLMIEPSMKAMPTDRPRITQTIKEPVPTDWTSPWRPAGAKPSP